MLDPSTRSYLVALARHALATALGIEAPAPARVGGATLDEPARVFVSWHQDGRLVGCIGTLEATRSLEDAVRHYAVQAGLYDPRLPAARPEDLPALDCEISVLSEPRPLDVSGLDAVARCIEPGVDGVILRAGGRRAVFLPVVWRMLPGREEFLHALCRKAGIDPGQREPPITAETFVAETFEEHGLPSPQGPR